MLYEKVFLVIVRAGVQLRRNRQGRTNTGYDCITCIITCFFLCLRLREKEKGDLEINIALY